MGEMGRRTCDHGLLSRRSPRVNVFLPQVLLILEKIIRVDQLKSNKNDSLIYIKNKSVLSCARDNKTHSSALYDC